MILTALVLLAAAQPAVDLVRFTQDLEALRQAAQIPGLSVAVVRDRELILARGLGYADLERQIPATAETTYNIASVSKPISAVVALKLAEEGKLDLDRPIAEYSDWTEFCKAFQNSSDLLPRPALRARGPYAPAPARQRWPGSRA